VPGLKCHGGKRHTCSDNEADADAEKSGAEDIPVKLKRKRRKVLRKRKKGKKCVQGMWLCFIVLDTVCFCIQYLHNFLLIFISRTVEKMRKCGIVTNVKEYFVVTK
jgi:hypothetical protein